MQTEQTTLGSLSAADLTDDEKRTLAGLLGGITTARKSKASAENGKKGGRPPRPLSEIPCTCGNDDSLFHTTRCPRGQAIRRRIASRQLVAVREEPDLIDALRRGLADVNAGRTYSTEEAQAQVDAALAERFGKAADKAAA